MGDWVPLIIKGGGWVPLVTEAERLGSSYHRSWEIGLLLPYYVGDWVPLFIEAERLCSSHHRKWEIVFLLS